MASWRTDPLLLLHFPFHVFAIQSFFGSYGRSLSQWRLVPWLCGAWLTFVVADALPIGGFMALWMLNWVFLAAVGLVLESMISLLTKEYIPCKRLSA
jgi:hypothetical protein